MNGMAAAFALQPLGGSWNFNYLYITFRTTAALELDKD